MRPILTIVVFLLSSLFSKGQNYYKETLNYFKRADSVLIVSHIVTENMVTDIIDSTKRNFYKLVVNNRPTYEILKESAKLNKVEMSKLYRLLVQPNNDKILEELGCFSPRHGILIFLGEKCLYYDICFHCRNYIASKEIELPNELNATGWENLKLFFQKKGIKYGFE